MTDVQIQGTVAEGFEAVRDAFEANFTEHGDVGAGVAVYVEGECVVDLVGGVHDRTTGAPYDEDSLQLVFSTTKGIAAIAANLLAERGLLDFDAKVADIWPEFGVAGKEDATVAMLFNHQVGLPTIDDVLTIDDVVATQPVVDALAAHKPFWEPGTRHGYHAVTYGWLVGEVVRRVTGVSLGTFLANEIAGPLGLDLWIGLPEELHDRVSPLIAPQLGAGGGGLPSEIPEDIKPLLDDLIHAFLDPQSLLNRSLSLNGTLALAPGKGGLTWNDPRILSTEIPSANGVTNARSIARLYAATVSEVDGIRLLSPETVAAATTPQREGQDETLVVPTTFGRGFMLASSFIPLLGGKSFGHAGAGGSLGMAEPDRKIGFGYVMNQMNMGLAGDQRTQGLTAAVLAAVG